MFSVLKERSVHILRIPDLLFFVVYSSVAVIMTGRKSTIIQQATMQSFVGIVTLNAFSALLPLLLGIVDGE